MLRPKRKITKREIRQDPLLETLYSAEKFYESHSKRIMVIGGGLLVLVLILLIGSGWRGSSRRTAEDMLSQAAASLASGNSAAAINELDLLVAEYPKSSAGREALFFMGRAFLSLDNPKAGRESLEEYLKKSKNSLHLCAAMEILGGIAESEGRYVEAAELFQRASSIGDFSFNIQQNRVNAAMSWLLAGEYDRASEILEDLEKTENPHALIRDQIEELSSRLKILSLRSN